MSNADRGRLSKRPRVADATHDKTTRATEGRTKRRRFSRNGNESDLVASKDANHTTSGPLSVTSSEDRRTHEPNHSKKPSPARWSVARPVAGLYSNLNPLFTADEEYVFLGLETSVQVYSVSTSRLFRTMQLEAIGKVVGYKLCPITREHLYIFGSSGQISKWDWITGKPVFHRGRPYKTISSDLTFHETQNTRRTVSYLLQESKEGKRQISRTCLDDSESPDVVVLESNRRITDFKVTQNGRVIMAWNSDYLLIGTANAGDMGASISIEYTWKEVALPVKATCLDVREDLDTYSTAIQESTARRRTGTIDIVLGESGGSILILNDAVNSFPNSGDAHQGGKRPTFRRFHWHRQPVGAVRWSRDGNYVISGGHESVMVLWQLDTGRKQFLPHLSSPICNIVVSPSGILYAVKLADNSIMVLSAKELQPLASIVGLQACHKSAKISAGSNQLASDAYRCFGTTAAALHPKRSDQLLIAVPASQRTSKNPGNLARSPVLQTYDIRTINHISRQALARTNTTTLSISPEGSEITTPDIEHLDVTQDGNWLATVDTWSPNPDDLKALNPRCLPINGKFDHYQEIFLKFWRWNCLSNLWELVTRVDGPHFSEEGSVSVLGLVSQPCSHAYATIGADAVLRFWCPNTRQRSGLKADSAEQKLETWKCRRTVDLKGYVGNNGTRGLNGACISFSEDGSVLAVCLAPQSDACRNVALLIDAHKCEVRHSRPGPFSGCPGSMRFIGRHLVIASNQSLSVWDTVDDVVRRIGSPEPSQYISTAVNSKTRTFAVATQSHRDNNSSRSNRKRRKEKFHIRIYDMGSLTLSYELALKVRPIVLLSDSFSGGYVVVDAAADVLRLDCLDRASKITNHFHELPLHRTTGFADLFGDHISHAHQKPHLHAPTTTADAEGTSLSPRALDGIFGNAPPFSLPSFSVLFQDVVQCLTSGQS